MKLIAIDLDGTLLNKEKVVSAENVTAIKKAQEMGVHVVIATGRHYQDAVKLIGSAGLHLPIIASNGASIHDLEGNCIQSIGIDSSDLKFVFSELEKENISFMALGANHVYTLKSSLDIMSAEVEAFKVPEFEKEMYRIKEELTAMVTYKEGLIYEDPLQMAEVDDRILNILALSYDSKKRLDGMKHFEAVSGLHVFSSYKNNFEMTHPEVSKGNSVKLFASNLGIKDYDICAIGDNYNDVSMLKIAGIGVAMGNAEDGVKVISDFVTLTNNESGVSHAIHKVLMI